MTMSILKQIDETTERIHSDETLRLELSRGEVSEQRAAILVSANAPGDRHGATADYLGGALRLRATWLEGWAYAAEPAESGSCAARWSAGGKRLAATGLAERNRLGEKGASVTPTAYMSFPGTPGWRLARRRGPGAGSRREDPPSPERVPNGRTFYIQFRYTG